MNRERIIWVCIFYCGMMIDSCMESYGEKIWDYICYYEMMKEIFMGNLGEIIWDCI